DLYASEWTGSKWGAPRNLGPVVNSPAHEYDPAAAPDDLGLYFASNRTPDMRKGAGDGKADDLGVTVRAHPGLPRFDLFVSRRPSPADAWGAPEPLDGVNQPDSNEGAPFVSPSGNFLYFASDRPARPGEATNLDLYRARLVDGRFAA